MQEKGPQKSQINFHFWEFGILLYFTPLDQGIKDQNLPKLGFIKPLENIAKVKYSHWRKKDL
jgi:hypothetical protein